ncbi:hypothetical protein AB1N83_012627 [Pleurotus pulmonarius]
MIERIENTTRTVVSSTYLAPTPPQHRELGRTRQMSIPLLQLEFRGVGRYVPLVYPFPLTLDFAAVVYSKYSATATVLYLFII